jgi:enamine deaminase RidA (YjgF/YER057c/UK114 family)
MVAAGRMLAVGGQIGGRPPSMELARGMTAQFAQCLDNVLAVVDAAGGRAKDVISMTIYVTDRRAYSAATKEIGAAWRDRFGTHYPAMALVEVTGLLEPEALVEIQALAVLP